MTKAKTTKLVVPDYMKTILEPVGDDRLNKRDREQLTRINSHRKPDDLKAAYTGYRATIAGFNDADFLKEAKDKVWLSAYASNNPRSDYHWQCDLCYDEAVRRGGVDAPLYNKAHKAVMQEAGY